MSPCNANRTVMQDRISQQDLNSTRDLNSTQDRNSTQEQTVTDGSGGPLCASTPLARPYTNGHRASDSVNGNDTLNLVSECTSSMDVLSGGESDAGDTLNRRNNNSISSTLTGTLREANSDLSRRKGADLTYFIAKELLMTERTYKRDLELVTVTWSSKVSELCSAGADIVSALARACLALEPLALPAGALLARLERALANTPHDNEEPEYNKLAELLYDFLTSTYDAYTSYIENAGTLVGIVESVRRRSGFVQRAVSGFESASPLPLHCLLLRPLHRLLHYERLAVELSETSPSAAALAALPVCRQSAADALAQLRHVENHAALCQLQRDLLGYDKLLVPEREFVRLGCVYKHSNRGLQQRMLFLFNDVVIVSSKAGATQFRAHAALPLHALELKPATDLPHSFSLTGEDTSMLLSASNEFEYASWVHALDTCIRRAKDNPGTVDTELTPYEQDAGISPSSPGAGGVGSAGGALPHVCWHRATSLSRDHLHLAMSTQLSGYLLRKFKNSHGWQKLWVSYAAFCLFFYKSWQDANPLASLPLLGYIVGPPAENDGIHKEFVFKLQFKNHVYFFRADSHYTYNRWTEVLQTATVHSNHNI